MAKRRREKARLQRQEAKRARRETIAAETENLDSADEARLLNEFRVLSERHATGDVSNDVYARERRRIFVDLGIERSEESEPGGEADHAG
jgi:uncharacterized membrane protein